MHAGAVGASAGVASLALKVAEPARTACQIM
jgi:hypothetical protein